MTERILEVIIAFIALITALIGLASGWTMYQITIIRHQTNSIFTEMQRLATAKGKAEGVKQERARQEKEDNGHV